MPGKTEFRADRPPTYPPISEINIEDLRQKARKRLPRVVFGYIDGGSRDEVTLRANRQAFDQFVFRPRQAVKPQTCNTVTRILGTDLPLPVLLAPVGYTRLFHPHGEIGAATAAARSGTIYILSTISGHPLEDVRAAASAGAWFQLYLLGGRETAEATLDRAQRAGYSALVVTVDTPISGVRERDLRNGMKQLMGGNPLAMLPFLSQFFTRPRWVAGFLMDGGMSHLPNVVVPGRGPMSLTDVMSALHGASVTWDDLPWIRQIWNGPIVIKGILTSDDARRCVDCGASAIVVSNHGGRQLDGVAASLNALCEIVPAVDGQVEILMDGGIRRGSDVVKALCCGAKAVLIGRAYAYGMAARGTNGAVRAVEILRAEIENTLQLLGCDSIDKLDRTWLGSAAAKPDNR